MADNDSRKNLHSVYFSDGVWESMQTYARFFSAVTGIKNNRGQAMGAGTFVDIACKAYIKQNERVLEIAEQFFGNAGQDDIDEAFQSIMREMHIYSEEE